MCPRYTRNLARSPGDFSRFLGLLSPAPGTHMLLLRCRRACAGSRPACVGRHRLLPATRQASSRTRGLFSPTPAEPLLTSDVDPTTGLCAGGLVRIGPSHGKGHGAFATQRLEPPLEVGQYIGELLLYESDKEARYGISNSGLVAASALAWQREWSQERQGRGVSVTGGYVLTVGRCPSSGRQLLLDAEDPARANWTRFVNHSARSPNLRLVREFASAAPARTREFVSPPGGGEGPLGRLSIGAGAVVEWCKAGLASLGVHPDEHSGRAVQPVVRFVVERRIEPGEELTFNYGTGSGLP